jgi:hypothetical protein
LLIGARRNADNGKYYWRITPWIAPFYTLIPPRGGHPVSGHAWVPIDDESCWAWSVSYHPRRELTLAETSAMRDGKGIHVEYIPGTFIPLANKRNDYLMDRAAQRVRSCAIELAKDVKFVDGAKDGLFRPLGTDPVSV